MRRLRSRLDRIENKITTTAGNADNTLSVIKDFVEDLADGVHLSLMIAGNKIPVVITLDPRE